jgi:hypothetical protein
MSKYVKKVKPGRVFEYDLDKIRDYGKQHVETLADIQVLDITINRLKRQKKAMLVELRQGMGEIMVG